MVLKTINLTDGINHGKLRIYDDYHLNVKGVLTIVSY